MSANTVGNELYIAENETRDPGPGGTISVEKSLSVCNLVSLGAEPRLLPVPVHQGVLITFFARSLVGSIILTVTGGLDLNATPTFVFTAEGQYLMLQSFRTKTGALVWRKISSYAVGNLPTALEANDPTDTPKEDKPTDTGEHHGSHHGQPRATPAKGPEHKLGSGGAHGRHVKSDDK